MYIQLIAVVCNLILCMPRGEIKQIEGLNRHVTHMYIITLVSLSFPLPN